MKTLFLAEKKREYSPRGITRIESPVLSVVALQRRQTQKAFTLIELLVVIAIIGLLAALLMPSISAARKSAQSSACASNMREIGKMIMLFAGDHEGRYPAGGGMHVPNSDFPVSITSWQDAINEYMGRTVIPRLPVNPNSSKTQGKLYCPSMKLLNDGPYDQYKRGYMLNEDAAGGLPDAKESWVVPGPGPFGMIDPSPPDRFQAGVYRLGASTSICQRPAYMFLLTETSRYRDYVNVFPSEMPDGEPTLADSTRFPEWAGNQGFYSFRHKLQANFLFFDLHVEKLSPTDGIVLDDRFNF